MQSFVCEACVPAGRFPSFSTCPLAGSAATTAKPVCVEIDANPPGVRDESCVNTVHLAYRMCVHRGGRCVACPGFSHIPYDLPGSAVCVYWVEENPGPEIEIIEVQDFPGRERRSHRDTFPVAHSFKDVFGRSLCHNLGSGCPEHRAGMGVAAGDFRDVHVVPDLLVGPGFCCVQ